MNKSTNTKIHQVKTTDLKLIERIAAWYLDEWGIPKERTISRISNSPIDDVLVQLVLKEGNRIIATGGLYFNTGLTIIFPKYKALFPRIGMLYTCKEFRGKGYGALLLKKLEEHAFEAGYAHVYLFTSTAEKLYGRNGYVQIERLQYRGADTVVMEKKLERSSTQTH